MEHNSAELVDDVSDVSQVGSSFTAEEDQHVADVETNINDVPQLEELSSDKFYQEQRSSDLFQREEAECLTSDVKEGNSLNVEDKSLQDGSYMDVNKDENLILKSEEERDSDNHSDDMLNFEDDQLIETTPENMKMDVSANMDYQEEEESKQVDEKVVEAEDSFINPNSSETEVNLSQTTKEDNQNNTSQSTSQETSQDPPGLILISNDEKNLEAVIVAEEEASKEEEKGINLEEMAIALTAVTDQQQPSASVETTVAPARMSVSPRKSDPIEEPHLHHIKTIQDVEGKKLAIVTQNENGPCPLVAIINVRWYFCSCLFCLFTFFSFIYF